MLQKMQFAQEDCPAEIREQLLQMMRQEWPNAFEDVSLEHVLWPETPDTYPVSLVYLEGGMVISHVAVPRKEMMHAGTTYQAYGISEVMTHPRYRRQGFGVKLMREAEAYIASQHSDLSVFTCDSRLIPFYTQAGWTYRKGTYLVGGTRLKPFRSESLGLATMLRLYSEQAQAQMATFQGADLYVELGEHKLW